MVSLRTLKPQILYALLGHQKSSLLSMPLSNHQHVINYLFHSTFPRTLSTGDRFETVSENIKKKGLDVIFKEAVGISENPDEESELSDQEEIKNSDSKSKEIFELKKKLKELEKDVRKIKGNPKVSKKRKNDKGIKKKGEEQVPSVQSKDDLGCKEKSDVIEEEGVENGEETKCLKELSLEMFLLAGRLYEKGYLKKANFLRQKELGISCFSSYYSRTFLRFAAERFGEDHQDIAKCLSGDDLKRIALFGCPSVGKKTAFAAKRLRSYFSIHEDMVCRPCKLKSSCKVMNHTVGQKVHLLNLADVMKVLTLYALDLVPPQLSVPEEIKGSISKLLREADGSAVDLLGPSTSTVSQFLTSLIEPKFDGEVSPGVRGGTKSKHPQIP